MAAKRHFTGRAVSKANSDSDSDSDSDSQDEQQVQHIGSNELETAQNGEGFEKSTGSHPIKADDPAIEGEEETEEAGNHAVCGGGDSSSEADSESDSDGEESDDGSGDELIKMEKPVFLNKKQRLQKSGQLINDKQSRDNERALKTIVMLKDQEEERRRKSKEQEQNLGGIDDTDGLDPEEELRLFEQRKQFRENRDRAILEKEQEELEELELRRLRTEEERDEEFKEQQKKQSASKSNDKLKGAFYLDEELRRRKLEGDIEKYDKTLLPQRYIPKH